MNSKSQSLYQSKFKKYGATPKSLLWKTKGAAHQRFRQIWKEVDFSNKKVLDIGCGFGEFGKFILKRYKNVDYTGIDIVPEFIEEAKKNVPDGKFFVADYLKENLNGRYEVAVASGVLNSNVETSLSKVSVEQVNLEYRKEAIKKMFSLTDGILIFNMLGGHPAPVNKQSLASQSPGRKGSNVWYSDSLEILEHCMLLTRRVILRANYHPKDFTIVMERVKR